MKIALIELESLGHHYFLYLKTIIDALKKTNIKIYVVLSSATKKIIRVRNSKFVKYIFVKKLVYPNSKNFLNLLIFQIKSFLFLKKIYKKNLKIFNLDHIYLNNMDHYDKMFSIMGSPFENVKFSGILINPNIIKKHIFDFKNLINYLFFKKILKSKNLTKIAITNPIVYKKINGDKLYKLQLLNEISSTSNAKRKFTKKIIKSFKEKFSIKENDIVLLVYGSIRLEKGIGYIVEALQNINLSNTIKIIIAGKQNKEFSHYIKNLLNKKPFLSKKIIIYNKIVSDYEEKLFFKISDYVWVGYNKNFLGSSAVLFLSSFMKIPVIGGNAGLIGYYIKKYKMGYSLDLENTKKLVNLFNGLNKKRIFPLKNFYIVNNKFTLEKFQTTILKKLIELKNFSF